MATWGLLLVLLILGDWVVFGDMPPDAAGRLVGEMDNDGLVVIGVVWLSGGLVMVSVFGDDCGVLLFRPIAKDDMSSAISIPSVIHTPGRTRLSIVVILVSVVLLC